MLNKLLRADDTCFERYSSIVLKIILRGDPREASQNIKNVALKDI